MATTFPNISKFPIFTDTYKGLVKLTPAGKIDSDNRIEEFKIKVRDQPPFFITKESWKLLSNGMRPGGLIWIPLGYEVYAFVFCVAFDRQNLSANKPCAYFRIRTILKRVDELVVNGKVAVLVDTNNIAYVNIDKALLSSIDDCVEFLDVSIPAQKIKKDLIDEEVIVKPSSVTITNPYNSHIPDSFKNLVIDNDINTIIKNEGAIFGKEGIWDSLLSIGGKYHYQKNSLISLTWNKRTKHISFDFKINDQYEALRDCPQPPVCPKA
jgi:hypothetical protein